MKNHREMFEALLAGETLVTINNYEYKLIDSILVVKDGTTYKAGWELFHNALPHYENVRIKPKTIIINGLEVPEPLRVSPETGTIVYIPDISSKYMYKAVRWQTSEIEANEGFLKRGFVHTTKEAAIAHAKALLSFTERKE